MCIRPSISCIRCCANSYTITMDSCKLQELGLTFEFSKKFQTKLGNQWNVAQKLSVSRIFSFIALSQLLDEFKGIGMTALSCVDAVPGLGIAGTIWKKYYGKDVAVTINSSDENTKKVIEENMQANGIDNDTGICVFHRDTNALLHSDQKYNFIYLEAYGTCVKYLESACRALCHRGVLCIVSTDLSTLYNKSPERVQRIYHGHTLKHEYVRELAVRLVLANVARAASRWDRGVSVLMSYINENCIVVLVRVLKGATHADKSLEVIRKIAHCRVCSFRCLVNEKLHYSPQTELTNCHCKEDGLVNGDILPPIVMLGPVYTGSIFEPRFLVKMRSFMIHFDANHKLMIILDNMILESVCLKSEGAETKFRKILDDSLKEKEEADNTSEEPLSKKSKPGDGFEQFFEQNPTVACPVFFYVPQIHIKKGLNPPKIPVVIQKLRAEGFQASRTMFDPRAIRTSASPKEFRNLISEIAKETLPILKTTKL